ncbi:hypothetical protein F8388_014328 [Cannabis sativa]|uniref:Uncharacterized protein n=1 Tax=Cannabis sativa TaxID=3483 RepID=A0A7J6EJD1_CANSA|nr:hypothetical protein F8388_014328 [Cannabis sativa]
MRTISSTGLSPSPATATVEGQRSPWHSPVPYLFGGLAAMLGLIAFALLILACSYWRLNGQNNNDGERDDNRDLENGSGDGEKDSVKGVKVYEEKFLVIMAGDEKPSEVSELTDHQGLFFLLAHFVVVFGFWRGFW